MKNVVIVGLVFFVLLTSCYKAGNLKLLNLGVDTKLRSRLIRGYIDTLAIKGRYTVPQKWVYLDKLVDLDSIYNKRVYFKEDPEEMYLLCFGGMFQLCDVYNPQIVSDDWITHESRLTEGEEARIKKRLSVFLNEIEELGKKDRVPDSLMYK